MIQEPRFTFQWRKFSPVSYLSETNCKVVTSFKGVELEVEVSAMISTAGTAKNTFDHILRGIEIE